MPSIADFTHISSFSSSSCDLYLQKMSRFRDELPWTSRRLSLRVFPTFEVFVGALFIGFIIASSSRFDGFFAWIMSSGSAAFSLVSLTALDSSSGKRAHPVDARVDVDASMDLFSVCSGCISAVAVAFQL